VNLLCLVAMLQPLVAVQPFNASAGWNRVTEASEGGHNFQHLVGTFHLVLDLVISVFFVNK